MFDSQIVIAKGTDYSLFGPWMSRGGDYLQATLNIVAVNGASGSPKLTVKIYTKNSEDPGDGSDSSSSTTVKIEESDVGVFSAIWRSGAGAGSSGANANLDELIRYHYTISGTSGHWLAFRMLSPVWFDSVQATS